MWEYVRKVHCTYIHYIKSSVSTAVASCSGSVPCYLFVPLEKFGISDSNKLYDINFESYFSYAFFTPLYPHCTVTFST